MTVETNKRGPEMEGRVSSLEAGQEAIQGNIRELTRVITDLAQETRHSLSVIQRPNWQYLAVLLGIIVVIGNFYIRDQNKQEEHIKGLQEWQINSVRSSGYIDGVIDCLRKDNK
jgi:hypothetical protein